MNCGLCGRGSCVFEMDPVPRWARDCKDADFACYKKKHGELNMPGGGHGQDLFDDDIHDDREELTDEAYADKLKQIEAEINKRRKYQEELKEEVARSKEKDPHGMDQHEKGAKLDHGKVDIFKYFLAMFPDAVEAVAWVSQYGATKYTYMGWSHVPQAIERYTAAQYRHGQYQAKGEVYDDGDSELPHAAQEAWNAMAKLQKMIDENVVEIRKGKDLGDGK